MDKRIVGTNAGKVWLALKEQNLYSEKKWTTCFIR